MKTTEAACVSEELCRLLKEEEDEEVMILVYSVHRPFGYFKHVNSKSSGPGVHLAI